MGSLICYQYETIEKNHYGRGKEMKRKLIVLLAIIVFGITSQSHAEVKNDAGMTAENEDAGAISSDIFGRKGGYIHPSLSITELYSDNVFNDSSNEVDDFTTVVSPAIWLSIPGTREQAMGIVSSSVTPGGLDYDINYSEYSGRLQSSFLISADFSRYWDHSSADTDDFLAEGFLQYKIARHFTVEFVDQYTMSHDAWRTGTSSIQQLDDYKNNLFTLRALYELSSKIRVRANYANFNVNYDDSRNNDRDRMDNSFSGYIFFQIRPTYSIFAEYEYINVEYDIDTGRDNESHRFYGGVDWVISAKSIGRLQAGYTNKEFKNSSSEDNNDFILRGRLNHHFTSKTSLELSAYRQIRESYIDTLNDMITDQISARYVQRITHKITANLNLSYAKDDYDGLLTIGSETKQREDTFYNAAPSIEYLFRKWLSAQLAYEYSERDSNFNDFDYKTNTFLIRVKATL